MGAFTYAELAISDGKFNCDYKREGLMFDAYFFALQLYCTALHYLVIVLIARLRDTARIFYAYSLVPTPMANYGFLASIT